MPEECNAECQQATSTPPPITIKRTLHSVDLNYNMIQLQNGKNLLFFLSLSSSQVYSLHCCYTHKQETVKTKKEKSILNVCITQAYFIFCVHKIKRGIHTLSFVSFTRLIFEYSIKDLKKYVPIYLSHILYHGHDDDTIHHIKTNI